MRTVRTPAWMLAAASIAAFAAGFLVARGLSSTPATPESGKRLEPEIARGAASGGSGVRHVGSVFRNRISSAESPMDGVEMVLVSSRRSEPIDGCPLCLRVLGGEKGGRLLGDLVDSFEGNVKALEAEAVPATFSEELRSAFAELKSRARIGSSEGPSPSLRALFLGLPRADLGAGTSCVGVALYDHGDAHFDEPGAAHASGVRLTMARIERSSPDDPRFELVSGAVEVARSIDVPRGGRAPEDDPRLVDLFSNLRGHFGDPLPYVQGLYLDRQGTVHAYGPDLRLHALPENAEVRDALRELLRRL